MIKMEKVWSNLTDSSPLNAKCIDRDSNRGLCPFSFYLEKSKEPIRVFITTRTLWLFIMLTNF